MKILVKSVYDAFDYCMSHYYPFGLEEFAERSDRYAVISIQDSHLGGFGFKFTENNFCTGVLTLLFDDTVRDIPAPYSFQRSRPKGSSTSYLIIWILTRCLSTATEASRVPLQWLHLHA